MDETSKAAYPLVGMGDVYAASGDFANAKKSYEESLAISREAGEKHESAVALANLGAALMQQGDLAGARATEFARPSICGTKLARKAESPKSLFFWQTSD